MSKVRVINWSKFNYPGLSFAPDIKFIMRQYEGLGSALIFDAFRAHNTDVAFFKAGVRAELVTPSNGGRQKHWNLTHPASLEMEEFLEMLLGDMWKSESDWRGCKVGGFDFQHLGHVH